ncbi:hypothetical protein TraAM80_03648 [Trypanosoma rangeli]|uniref:Uncharacterized protein n=1 Tax=Trypanosoma rangeli TaxID=5698 RepID=A0A3R7MR30_TRYRA|nr:uncharacterized protein TraAM80_03648 [Trypanosoma rangeli]RNF06815.1 hypothetical protein TraAM80_03648 [Trypanosoma rangeli]|eukprot:RNF06815.1 hypothetical protein TraAM80_03648 [Trypanosoma rangeli]
MTFHRAFPPRRLPSRRATSHAATPPEVPTYRAYSSGYHSPRTPRFRVPPLSPPPSASPQQQQQQQQELREAEEGREWRGWGGVQELLVNNGSSPSPKLSIHASFAESQHLVPSAKELDEEHTPHRHFYRVGGDDVCSVKLVAFSIYNSMTVTGIVEVTPCQWRLNANPSLYPVQLQIRQLDTNTYPMRRLLRLIQRKVPDGAGGESGIDVSPQQQPMRGSLYIFKMDNPHLQFVSGLPSIVPLSGSIVLADVVRVDQIPINGAAVQFRWIEDTPRRVLVDIDTPLSGDDADETAVRNYKPPSSDSVARTCQEHGGGGHPKHVHNEAEKNNFRASWLINETGEDVFLKLEEGNNLAEHSPHVTTDNSEYTLNILPASVIHTAGAASPITYLHTPYIR